MLNKYKYNLKNFHINYKIDNELNEAYITISEKDKIVVQYSSSNNLGCAISFFFKWLEEHGKE